jgi:hypothetical protein
MENEAGFFEGMKETQVHYKTNIKKMFDEQRMRYKTDPQAKKLLDQAQCNTVPQRWLVNRTQLELLRETVIMNEVFNPSDALDFSHAVVGVSYCDFVVLDKKWARRCRGVALPHEAARVFDGTQINEFVTA